MTDILNPLHQPLVENAIEVLPLKKKFRSFVLNGKRAFSSRRQSVLLTQMNSCKTLAELELKYPSALQALIGDAINATSYQTYKSSESIYKHHCTVFKRTIQNKL